MAFLYVTEYAVVSATLENGQLIQAPLSPPLADYRIAIGGASLSSPAFQKGTRFIMVHADAVCSLAFDANAVTTAHRLGQNETRFYGVTPTHTVSVISNT